MSGYLNDDTTPEEHQRQAELYGTLTASVRDLVDATDYPDFGIEGVAEMFKQWKRDKKRDILGYRNQQYRSLLTGNLAPVHHTPWMLALDDSLPAFLGNRPEHLQVPIDQDQAVTA